MRKRRIVGSSVLLALAAWAALGATALAAPAAPPGNNGTVKIHGEPLNTSPANEPHVPCTFALTFWGYDRGDLWASYDIVLHPPTSNGSVASGNVFIGEDNAGGGTDLDAEEVIDLAAALFASGVEPHPIQGWHLKLIVNAQGSIGADVKHKVFWVTCPYPPNGIAATRTSTEIPAAAGGQSGIPLGALVLVVGVAGVGASMVLRRRLARAS
jgi:hypothetical protein